MIRQSATCLQLLLALTVAPSVRAAAPAAAPAPVSAAPPPNAPAPAVAGSSAPASAAPAPPTSSSSPAAASASAPAPAPAAPVPALATVPVPAPAAADLGAATLPRIATSPAEAVVHVAVNYRDAWLETRSYVDNGPFVRTCRVPCDIKLHVEGLEARVAAPGMTTSNVFRFAPGSGTAGVRVDGGSASARRAGIITLAAGIPVALAGMALFAQGRLKQRGGLEAAGIAALSAGGLSIAVSLPLLLMGTTHVKNAGGSLIASNLHPAAL